MCFHTDIFEIGLLSSTSAVHRTGRKDLLKAYASTLLKVGQSRTLLFPTFNYDYFKTRIYDVSNDRVQVGVLNEYFRTLPQSKSKRTHTPVFNFSIFPPESQNTLAPFSITAQNNPFSEKSTFAEMCRAKTWMCFLGAPLARSTLIHLCEYTAKVGFRYAKSFPGVVLSEGRSIPIDFSFRVRIVHPLMPITFDWSRLEREMLSAGVIRTVQVNDTQIFFYRADQAFNYWMDILKKDELGLYTPEGKRSVQKLYDTLGYPLTLEMFELPQP